MIEPRTGAFPLTRDSGARHGQGVGHFLFMEKPKEFNDAMIGFLKKQGAYQ